MASIWIIWKIHSDNGGPMKGATLLATLQFPGIIPSFSRPCVYDDNPYSEALFRTLKYSPEYPSRPFQSVQEAQRQVERFDSSYSTEHRHRGMRFVTPSRVTPGGRLRCSRGARKYRGGQGREPESLGSGNRNWSPIAEVSLNPVIRRGEHQQRASA